MLARILVFLVALLLSACAGNGPLPPQPVPLVAVTTTPTLIVQNTSNRTLRLIANNRTVGQVGPNSTKCVALPPDPRIILGVAPVGESNVVRSRVTLPLQHTAHWQVRLGLTYAQDINHPEPGIDCRR